MLPEKLNGFFPQLNIEMKSRKPVADRDFRRWVGKKKEGKAPPKRKLGGLVSLRRRGGGDIKDLRKGVGILSLP